MVESIFGLPILMSIKGIPLFTILLIVLIILIKLDSYPVFHLITKSLGPALVIGIIIVIASIVNYFFFGYYAIPWYYSSPESFSNYFFIGKILSRPAFRIDLETTILVICTFFIFFLLIHIILNKTKR